jgi:hypothetical protein
VNEEFLTHDQIGPDSCRLLAVVLESRILNPALIAYLRVPLSSAEIHRQWQMSRQQTADPEAEALDFIPLDLDALARLALSERWVGRTGTGLWHPTSRYRIIAVMLAEFGADRTERALESLAPHG